MFSLSERAWRSALLGLLWIVGILCTVSFDLRDLWPDEGIRLLTMNGNRSLGETLATRQIGRPGEVLEALAPIQYQPAFYLLGNGLFQVIGHPSVVTIRIGNILVMFAAIAGLLRLFRAWPSASRFWLVFLFSMNGYMLMHVMHFREYPLFVALSIWSSVFFFDLYESDLRYSRATILSCTGYVLTGILGYYTSMFFLFTLGAQAVFVFWRGDRRLRFLQIIWGGLLCVALGALPWLVWVSSRFPGRTDPGRYSLNKPQTIGSLLESLCSGFWFLLTYNSSTHRSHPESLLYGLLNFYALCAGLAIAGVVYYAVRQRKLADPRLPYAITLVLVYLAFQVTWYFRFDQLSTWPRYFIGHYAGIVILLGFGLHTLVEWAGRGTGKGRGTVLCCAFALAALAGCTQIYGYIRMPYIDTATSPTCEWSEIGNRMNETVKRGDTIAYYHRLMGWTLSQRFRVPARETNFDAISAGNFELTPTIWLLDVHVHPEHIVRAREVLTSRGYQEIGTTKLGCLADILRFDLSAEKARGVFPVEAPGPGAIVREAERFTAGTAEVNRGEWGDKIGVLVSPRTEPGWAEYELRLPKAGKYEILARFASAEPRPLELSVDGQTVNPRFCSQNSGGYKPEDQKWFSGGIITFTKTDAKLRIQARQPFPHVDKLALVPQ